MLLPITGHDVHSVELIYVKVVSERKKNNNIQFICYTCSLCRTSACSVNYPERNWLLVAQVDV